jgi:ribonuclease Y
MDNVFAIALFILFLAAAGFAVFLYVQLQNLKNSSKGEKISELEAIERASEIAKQKIVEAEQKAGQLERQAQEQTERIRTQIKNQEKDLNDREKLLLDRSSKIDQRLDQIEKKEEDIEQRRKGLKTIEDELAQKLETVANYSREQAKEELMKQTEKELSDWIAKKIKESESQVKQQSEEISQEILTEAMMNSAVDYTSETTTTSVEILDENLKGRIIGKEGRNIRTFEKLTGVDVIVDEAPNQVIISCFDPIRREVGALALQKLIKDGKIHPASIEETIEKVKKDMLREIKKTGEYLAFESGFNDLPNEIIMILGRFKYRFSYGQNLAKHSLEMVRLAEVIAQQIGADVEISNLAALLHDLGKVAPQEGKQHHHISAEIVGKYYKDERLINAIEAHHFDIDAKFIEAEVVRIADAISGARPGARRDSYEDYIKRIRALEDIANKHKGVKQSFAIKAGREVRVIVKPNEITDEDTKKMAYDIAKEIEETQTYPGVIKVNVIREFRATEEAQ